MTDPKDVIAKAVKTAAPAKRSPKKDKPGGAPTGGRKDGDTPYDLSFPEDCPIEPLGFNGDDVYFLDQARQLRVFKAKDLNQGNIRSLFGDMQDLKFTYWPRYSKPDADGNFKLMGWKPEQAADVLYAECRRRGHWHVLDRVRGPGSWVDENGTLVMHCGDLLYHGADTLTPRQIGRHVYPSAPAKPRPNIKADGKEEAEELLALLRSWNWHRADLDPVLLLGWIGAAIAGGALDWRPLVWITGDSATGKSTLHKVVRGVLGDGGVIKTADATAAGLWQTVGHASLPVALDELEAGQDDRKAQNIINLARIAASGDQMLRGGSDHNSSSFTVRSCFLFSSILMPARLGQDVNRMAVLQLAELGGDAKAPNLEPQGLARIGAALRGRILREWPRLQGLLETWKAQLAVAGHGGRGADLFGTMMAFYDLLTSDYDPDADTLEQWASLLAKKTLAESADDESNHAMCLSHLLTSTLDLYRSGERRTVGSWVIQAAGRDKNKYDQGDIADANRALGNIGLMVKEKNLSADGKYKTPMLFVANKHQGLAPIYKESQWKSNPGTQGVWVQALRRVKGALADEQRFNGFKERCTAIPLSEILEGEDE